MVCSLIQRSCVRTCKVVANLVLCKRIKSPNLGNFSLPIIGFLLLVLQLGNINPRKVPTDLAKSCSYLDEMEFAFSITCDREYKQSSNRARIWV